MQNTFTQLENFESRQMKFIEVQSIPSGQIPEQVDLYTPASVLLVKKYKRVVKSLIKRVLG